MAQEKPEPTNRKLTVEEAVRDIAVSPPTVYMELRKAMNNPETTFEHYGKIVHSDPSLLARLLKVVNSPFFGFPSQVDTISHAMSIIGIDQLSELALVTGLLERFEKIPNDIVNMKSFWIHSLACGLAAQALAKKLELPKPERLYVAGMLHDIGKLLIFIKFPEEVREMYSVFFTAGKPLLELEKDFLGFTHQQAGRALLKAWKLPESLVEVVAFHHRPSKSPNYTKMSAILHLADHMAYTTKLGDSGEPTVPSLDENAGNILGVKEKVLNDISIELEEWVEQAKVIML